MLPLALMEDILSDKVGSKLGSCGGGWGWGGGARSVVLKTGL